MKPGVTQMQDWRGVEIKVGDIVVYPVRHTNDMWMVEGEVVELHSMIEERWGTGINARLLPTQVGGVTVKRRRTSEWDGDKIPSRHVKVSLDNLTVVATKVIPDQVIRTYAEYRERYGTFTNIEIDGRAS